MPGLVSSSIRVVMVRIAQIEGLTPGLPVCFSKSSLTQ